ncbi:hypothetical protein JQ584_46425 [Bradyrhizobium liaoningense]|nr:hypothetical protein [Bradyrhizobium liaoningense]
MAPPLGQLPKRSPRELATLGKLAERERFELAVWFSNLFILIVGRRAQHAHVFENVISRGDPVAILQKKKAASRAAFQINADLSARYLVAGIGFEPMTFRL